MSKECCSVPPAAVQGAASTGATSSAPVASQAANSTVFRIDKMDCPTEEALLRKALGGLPGVRQLNFNLLERTLKVEHNLTDLDPIANAIAALGMAPVLQSSAAPTAPASAATTLAISRKQWILMTVAGVAAIGSEAAAYATGNETSPVVAILVVITILAGGLGTLKKGWIALRTFSLNINLLMTVA